MQWESLVLEGVLMNLSHNWTGIDVFIYLKSKFQRTRDPSSSIGWFSISGACNIVYLQFL
jgi:hypothetical protein